MQVSDVVVTSRNLLAEPGEQRFSTPLMIDAVQRACSTLALGIDFPESTLTTSSVINQMEYQLPPLLKLLRVYASGQPIVPTDIPTLQGDQLQQWDDSAPGQQTQWQSSISTGYPVAGSSGGPVAHAPYTVGFRPQFYLRGGYIGFVPLPGNVYQIKIDCILPAPTLSNLSDPLPYPDHFRDALVAKVMEYCKLSDDADESADRWAQRFEQEMSKIRYWLQTLNGELEQGIQPITYRGYYQNGPLIVPNSSVGGP